MKQQHWTVARGQVSHPAAARRWDQAYQQLLSMHAAGPGVPETATPTRRSEESRHARSPIYARVSTQRQAQAQTTDQQLDRLRAHAEGQGWSVTGDRVFRDDGYSGASLRRPGLDRLRDAATSARLDRKSVV